jgi:Leucine-rich repeat (LRR) protein
MKLLFLSSLAILLAQFFYVESVILNRGWLAYWYPSYLTATKIDLSRYDIDTIDTNTFVDLTYLNELYLGFNQVMKIDDASTFHSLKNLQVLSIESNQLVSLNQSLFVGLENLEKVFLGQNPISSKNPNFVRSLCETNPKCTIYL